MLYEIYAKDDLVLLLDISQKKWLTRNKKNNTVYDLSIKNNLQAFLKLFYEEPMTFHANISKRLISLKVDESYLKELPIKQAIIFCIANKLIYWFELSLKWFAYLDLDDEFKEKIHSITKDKVFLKSKTRVK